MHEIYLFLKRFVSLPFSDYTSNRLYWVDKGLKQITSAALDDTDVKSLTRYTEELMWASGLAVFEDWIYWVTYQNNTIYRVDKENWTTFEVVKTGLHSPAGITNIQQTESTLRYSHIK